MKGANFYNYFSMDYFPYSPWCSVLSGTPPPLSATPTPSKYENILHSFPVSNEFQKTHILFQTGVLTLDIPKQTNSEFN